MTIPDENFHPVATGQAAKTVEAHKGPQDLVFYAGSFCPFVQRIWITLEERRIPYQYQYQEVNPYKKEAHFLTINPKGLVPAIEYKGRALYESLVLCEFLEDAFPGPTRDPHLLPANSIDRGYARIWIDYAGSSSPRTRTSSRRRALNGSASSRSTTPCSGHTTGHWHHHRPLRERFPFFL